LIIANSLNHFFSRPIIINFKNYPEIVGEGSIMLAKEAENVLRDWNVDLVLAPPICSLQSVSESVGLPVISQHVDDVQSGATTGFIVPESVKACGATGSIINHSEHKISPQSVNNLVKRLRGLNMVSIVCAADIEEAVTLSKFAPDFIAIEPPELIGKGVAVSKANPSIIVNTVLAISKISSKIKVLCGAGIVDKEDVIKALELGACGILVASGIVKASSWEEKIKELSSAFG
jgi:triosephosphate isomerase (TIM)